MLKFGACRNVSREIEYEIYNYARENLAIINIFIKEPYSKRFRKTEKMSRISYIASSGGLLGLCMGFRDEEEATIVNVAHYTHNYGKR
jgi:hypothetical protein